MVVPCWPLLPLRPFALKHNGLCRSTNVVRRSSLTQSLAPLVPRRCEHLGRVGLGTHSAQPSKP